MSKHSYEVTMVNLKDEEVTIYGPTPSIQAARSVARKQNPRRKVHIYRNQRRLQGGRAGLDDHAYQL